MSALSKRTCANCCAYEEGECMNGLGAVSPGDRCDSHKSIEEDRREDDAIKRFRKRLGLPDRKPHQNED